MGGREREGGERGGARGRAGRGEGQGEERGRGRGGTGEGEGQEEGEGWYHSPTNQTVPVHKVM